MQKRHFLVKEVNGEYQLREIEPAIARSVNQFGTTVKASNTIDSNQWMFYFMNCKLSMLRAQAVATELMQEALQDQ